MSLFSYFNPQNQLSIPVGGYSLSNNSFARERATFDPIGERATFDPISSPSGSYGLLPTMRERAAFDPISSPSGSYGALPTMRERATFDPIGERASFSSISSPSGLYGLLPQYPMGERATFDPIGERATFDPISSPSGSYGSSPQYLMGDSATLNPVPQAGQVYLYDQSSSALRKPVVRAEIQSAPTPGGSTESIINQLPALRGSTSGESRIDPSLRPYLELGLRRGEQLFFGEQQPSLYPGQMYVSPSQQTLDALAAQEQMARGGAPALEQSRQAFGEAMGGLSFTGMGGFLQGSPYRDLMIQAATRPILQQFEQTTLPGIQSAFSRAGRYGSGAQAQAIGQATEATGRAVGDVASQLAAADYARERGLQQQALGQQIAASQVAPQIYSQQFLPSQQLAQIGAAREAIAAQPLQEAMTRYQFAQQLPYQQLQTFLSGVYGTPMAASQYASVPQARTNTTAQILGGVAALGGLVPERQRAQAIDYITGLLGF